MSRDGLLPRPLAQLSSRRGRCASLCSPRSSWEFFGGGRSRSTRLVALANAGTLTAFIAVCAAMLTMRVRGGPASSGLFRTPLAVGRRGRSKSWAAPICSTACPTHTQQWFLMWNAVGAGHLFPLRGALCIADAQRRSCLKPRRNGGARPFPDRRLSLLIAVLLVPAALGSSRTIFNDGDVSWHIATGQWILDHRAIPHTDPVLLHLGRQAMGADRMARGGAVRRGLSIAGYSGVAALVTAALMALHALVFFNAAPSGAVGRGCRVVAMDSC